MNLWYLLAPATLATLGVLAIWWKVWRKISGLLDERIGKPAQFGRQAKPALIERPDIQEAARDVFQNQTEEALTEQGELLRGCTTSCPRTAGRRSVTSWTARGARHVRHRPSSLSTPSVVVP